MGETAKKKVDYLNIFHTAVVLFFLFGFGQLPAVEPITPIGMKVIGIFIGMIYGWSTVGLVWPSLLGLLALAFSGYMPLKTIWANSFGNDNVVQFIFIFVFAGAVEAHGVTKFIAFWMLTRKFVEGKPWMFTFIYLLAIGVLAALTSSSPAIILGWSILYSIFGAVGYKKGDKYVAFMIFGTIMAAQSGMAIVPFKSAPLAIVGAFEGIAGYKIDYLSYMAFMIITFCLVLLTLVAIGKYVLRLDVSALQNMKREDIIEDESVLKLNATQKVVFGLLIALVTFMILPSVLPKEMFLAQVLNSLGATGVAVVIVVLMCIVRMGGKPLMNFQPIAAQNISWGVLLLLASVMVISGCLSKADVGFVAWLKLMLTPVFGDSSPVFFVVMLVIVAVIFTNFCNNAATAIALMPIVLAFASALGISESLVAVVVTFSVMLAFLTPAASPSAALLHGNEWISKKDIYLMGFIAIGASVLVVLLVTFTIGNMLF